MNILPPSEGPGGGGAAPLSNQEKRSLLGCARQALVATVDALPAPEPREDCLTPALREERCCFVTLTVNGKLHGCIGNLQPTKPLFRAVIDNAVGAGFRDWRFSPLTAAEVESAGVEISVLSPPRLLTAGPPQFLLDQIIADEHGVIFRSGGKSSTFLPQVWRTFQEKTKFLGELCRKAGCAPEAWRDAEASLSVYTVEHFSEADFEAG